MNMHTICLVLTLLLAPAIALAQDAPVKAALLADVEAAAPGSEVTLGLRLTMAPHWHTYWVNPGESGEPTRIKWAAAPAAVTFGDIQWPLPMKIDVAGGITYGYEDEVLLLVPGKVAKDAVPGTKVTVSADASWLCCKETCIEGGAKLSIELPIAAESKPANAALFDAWRQRLPVAPNKAPELAKAEQMPGGTLVLRWERAPRKVEWFPVATREVAVEDVEVKHEDATTHVRYKTTVFKQPAPESIQSVLVYEDASGRRRGVTIPVGVKR